MIRTLFWFIVWLLTLGTINIKISYKDGLHIELKSWLDRRPSKQLLCLHADCEYYTERICSKSEIKVM